MIKILFLAANPLDIDRFRLDEEVHAIDEALRRADFRNQFELYSHWAVRVEDLQDLLLRYKPDIVHFSGHGQGTRFVHPDSTDKEATYRTSSQIVFQDANGQSVPVPPHALSDLFRVLKDNIRCVVLNACYSQAQAEGIAQHIDCVIGMSDAIPDVTAIVFATAFYRGLGYGRSLQLAFDLGCSQIDLSALRGSSIPQLIALRTGADRLVLAADGAFTQSEAVVKQAPGEPPYKGLQYFDTSDAHLFFGRERLTAELAAYLRTHNFLAVVGASGSGKSSVVRAGLVPALQRGEPLLDGLLPPVGSAQWPVHVMTPKAHPLKELAATLTRDDGSYLAQGKLMDELLQDARVLDLCASRLLSGGAANRLLLVVDQFEELFTLCRDQAERKAFVDNLLAAATEDGVTTVIITLRADFYAHCSQFSNLRLALESQQKYIGPMNRDELRRAIEEPARQEGWDFEPGLVDLLLHDVGDEPGALPLLSHALLETWNRRRGRTLTLAGYVESGRVQGAIAETAERVLTKVLAPAQQAIAKDIFLRLTELGEGSEDTRRRVQLAELMAQSEAQPAVETVLKTLADARLVTTDKDEVEVAHEALIRVWPTLRRWLDENREGLRIERRLTEAAREWEAFHREERLLYTGARFERAWECVKDKLSTLSALEQEFIETSYSLVEVERRKLEVDRLRREASEAKQAGNAQSAITALEQASQLEPGLQLDVATEIADVRRQIATRLVQAGERLAATGDYARAAEKFREAFELDPPPDTPVYVWIPRGVFLMGSDDSDEVAEDDEKPQRRVYVDGFWIMRVPVTNAQYRLAVEAGACTPPYNKRWNNAQFAQHPVTSVTWNQARDYAQWVGGRLPSEAEWEKAARGTDGRIYPWGNEPPDETRCNHYGSGLGTWTAIGSYPAGANGLYDAAGNVWEWTADRYDGNYYKNSPKRNPKGPKTGINRTLRGGSWSYSDFEYSVRCACRNYSEPDNHIDIHGFRVVSPGS